MLNAKIKRITSLLVLAAIVLTMISIPVYAQENDQDVDDKAEITVTPADMAVLGSRNTYSDYLDEHSEKARPMEEIVINATDYIKNDGAELEKLNSFEGKDDVLKWTNQGGEVTYSVDVANAGIYHINMVYRPLEGSNITTEFELLIDGELPFDSAARISMPRKWVNEYAIRPDERDNELRPPQVQEFEWMDKPIIDTDGLSNEPLIFYLTEGRHEITLVGTKANFAIKSMTFYNSEELPSYSTNKPSEAEVNSTPTFYEKIEGENAIYKTDSTLYPTYDRTSYLTSPSHPTKMRYNTIGQQNWKKAGQIIAWEVVVPNDGYYKIGIKARQNEMRGFFSNRRVYVDGEVLFEELDQVRFPYSMDWYTTTLSDGEEEIYIYLEADKKHVIELEAVPGVIGESMRRLDDIIFDLNYYYRRILMITGPEPDELNDYNIDVQIPNILEEFQRISDGLMQEKENIESMTKQKGSEATALEATAIILNRAIKKPEKIPMMLGSIKDNISSVSAWMREYRDQPLEVDYIEIGSHDAEFQPTKSNFFKSMSFGFQAFIGSFFEDYNVLTDERKSALNVWVSLGRDQAQVVKELTDSYFVPDYNTDVTINLVQGSILEATLAGKGPDIALFIGGDFPINLAVRGLLVDVSRYPDYEEVTQRFADDVMTLYTYDDKAYALPVSQTFPMLFYRKDVLEELGFNQPPETWTEFIDILRPLQRNHMQAGLILPAIVPGDAATMISTTVEPGHTFAMLLLQRGQNFYNEDLSETTFNTPEAYEAFETWTKFYNVFNFDQQYDAYSRFRTGEMPMVIQNYTFYNQLTVAAPEIRGLWDFAPVPGTVRDDGTISHAVNSAGAGAVIFNKVKDTDAAWEFIKWFTSADIQTQYGRTIEGLLGPLGRYDTANLEALEQLPWSTKEMELLQAQIDELEEVPVIPASYAVTRNIMNAFRSVANDATNPRDTLITYNRDINSEISRKRKELGID